MLAVALVRYWLMLEVLYVGSSTCTVFFAQTTRSVACIYT